MKSTFLLLIPLLHCAICLPNDMVSSLDHGGGDVSNRQEQRDTMESAHILSRHRREADMSSSSNVGAYVDTVGDYMNQVGSMQGPVQSVANIAAGILTLMMQHKQMKAQQKLWEMNRRIKISELCQQLCVTDWGLWSVCTARCGGGIQFRTREHILPGRCKHIKDFQCGHPTNHTAFCNRGCANHGRPKEERGACDCRTGFTGECCADEIICDYPGNPRNGMIEVPVPAKYGNVAMFSCREGYALVGNDTIICGENSKWNFPPPICKRIYCEDSRVPDPANGYIFNRQPSYRYGDVLAYLCDEGYMMRGPSTRRCSSEAGQARWTAFNPICLPLECGDPGFPLYGDRNGMDFSLGEVVTFTCNPGYRLIGSKERRCQKTGTWTGNEPTCQLMTCYKPRVPRNGRLVRARSTYPLGVIIKYECDAGFVLNGSVAARCERDDTRGLFGSGGSWSHPTPFCQGATCGDPGHPENGVQDGNVYYYPYNVSFTCFAGHVMRGPSQINCLIDGTWSAAIPRCEPCPLNFFKESVDSRAECVRCPAHAHTVTPASTSRQHCTCDHKYRGPPGGPCQEITCAVLDAPPHGSISQCGNKLEDECSFGCDQGHILSGGSGRRICQESGNWTGIQPVCQACPKDTFKAGPSSCLPCPTHSHTVTSGSAPGACVCDPGYEGPAGGPCKDVNECKSNSGRGPCQDLCENLDSTYRCSCSIPGYKIDPKDKHACIGKTCRNMTEDDAPAHGGLVCHWFRELNSQQCTVKCNQGYEFPSRFNNYEYCGSSTGYKWSHEERGDIFEPCIEEFFPGFKFEADAAYFVRACADLTDTEKDEVKKEFANRLNEEKLCKRGKTKTCNIESIGIICGRTKRRRRRRGIEEEEESVDFRFDIKVVQLERNSKNCDRICEILMIPARDCTKLCFSAYRRFLRASALYSKHMLHEIYMGKDLRFRAANRTFEPSGEAPWTSDVIVKCASGMEAVNGTCIPCPPGSMYSPDKAECFPCTPGTFQPEGRQYMCLPCAPGTFSPHHGAKTCSVCPTGTFGHLCSRRCECVHGTCDLRTGQCACASGWEGVRCDKDIQSCTEDACYPGVKCEDIKAPGLGFTCGRCPGGMRGNGMACTL